MKKQYLLPEEGNFYKANLHCHSTLSDGQMTPEEIKKLYIAHGYSVIAYTDHNNYQYHKELAEPDFLPLAGYELDVRRTCVDGVNKTCHINAIAIDPCQIKVVEKPAEYNFDTINKTIADLIDGGFIVNYNHPGWSAQDAREILALQGITAFEVYNHDCEALMHCGYGHNHYDIWLKSGKRAFAIATDDNHHVYDPDHINDTCGGFTMIKAKELTYSSIIEAFRRGDFYASNGPEIYSYYIEDETKLCIDCSPVKLAVLKGTRIGNLCHVDSAKGDLTHIEFDLSRFSNEPFMRVELVDAGNNSAFTNPYYR
jgi:hypothetical protein